MKTNIPLSINTIEEAKLFLSELHSNGETYHPEDKAADCLENITDEEATQLEILMNEIYILPENIESTKNGGYDLAFDPCEFILHLDPDYKKD